MIPISDLSSVLKYDSRYSTQKIKNKNCFYQYLLSFLTYFKYSHILFTRCHYKQHRVKQSKAEQSGASSESTASSHSHIPDSNQQKTLEAIGFIDMAGGKKKNIYLWP